MNKALILTAVLLVSLTSCGNRGNKKQPDSTQAQTSVQTADAPAVYVYYFHGKQRCKTCVAVGNVTEKTIKELYAGNQKVHFVEVKTHEDASAPLVEKYEVTWNALIIAGNDDFSDITKQAFANAISSPEVLQELIKAEVDKRL